MVSIWPFQKKTSPDRLPLEGPWSIYEGKQNGRAMVVRTNSGYRAFGSVSGYAHQVGIAVPMRKAEETGFPSPSEDVQLGEIEEILCSSLEDEAESLLVAVVTTGGMREFVFYTRKPQSVQHRFEVLRNRITSHEIQLLIQPDREWRVYARFAPE